MMILKIHSFLYIFYHSDIHLNVIEKGFCYLRKNYKSDNILETHTFYRNHQNVISLLIVINLNG